MKQTLHDLAEKLNCRLLGDGSITVTSVSSPQSATSDSLVFVDDAQYLDAALRSSAAAVIAGDFAASATSKPILISPQPRLPFAPLGRLVIEDDVEIGANSTIDRGALDETRIRRGTKIDNLVHIGHNVQIGQDVVIAAQTGLSGSVTIEDNVIMGGQVGIADHVRVEAGAILGAQSGIPTKKIIRGNGVVVWGTPARPIREYLKELAFLSRSAKKDR